METSVNSRFLRGDVGFILWSSPPNLSQGVAKRIRIPPYPHWNSVGSSPCPPFTISLTQSIIKVSANFDSTSERHINELGVFFHHESPIANLIGPIKQPFPIISTPITLGQLPMVILTDSFSHSPAQFPWVLNIGSENG